MNTDTTAPSAPLRFLCVSEAWDAASAVPYDSAADFLSMCLAVHGEVPALRRRDAEWIDDSTGEVVLVPAD